MRNEASWAGPSGQSSRCSARGLEIIVRARGDEQTLHAGTERPGDFRTAASFALVSRTSFARRGIACALARLGFGFCLRRDGTGTDTRSPQASPMPVPVPVPTTASSIPIEHLFASALQQQPQPQQTTPEERLAFLLVALAGHRVVATVKGGAQFAGILATATCEGELSLALRQAHALDDNDPAALPTPKLVILARDLYELAAEDVALEQRSLDSRDAFRTDTDISGLPGEGGRREKELQAWGGGGGGGDGGGDGTPGALGSLDDDRRAGSWDQFATNEKLYGTRTDYHEDIYTTKLDRSGSDYSARERRAAQLEREILKGTGSSALASNAHMAEERGGVDDSGLTEEDRYGAVVRGPDAYVPPGARKGPLSRFGATSNGASPPPNAAAPPYLPRISEPTVTPAPSSGHAVAAPAGPTPASGHAVAAPAGPTPANSFTLEENMRAFVTSEKARLTQRRDQVIKAAERKDQDSRIKSLLEFSQNFKLKTPIPEDMASIGRDSKPPSASTVTSPVQSPVRPARALTPHSTPHSHTTPVTPGTKSASTRSSPTAPRIAEIPPFRPKVPASAGSTPNLAPALPPVAALAASSPAPKALLPPTASTSKINPNAPVFVFRPNPNASAFTPSFAPSASRKPVELPVVPANPFFGNKQLKKGSPSMHVKEDFTPFKNGVVPDASTIAQNWTFTGKSYKSMFPDARPQGDEDLSQSLAGHQQPHLGPGGPMHPLHQGPPPPQGYPMYQPYQPNFNPRFQPPPQQQQQQPMQHMPSQMQPNGSNIPYNQYPPMGFQQSQGPPHGGPMYNPSPQMQPQPQPYMRYAPNFQPGQPPNGVPLGFQPGP